MTMNLNQLRQIGGILTGQAVAREVTWKRLNEEGEEVEDTFTVGVVKMGLAAGERIFGLPEGESRNATFIHEAIRLGEDFGERIPYEMACELDPGLFAELSKAAASINPKPKNAGGEGNASAPTTSSGATSSSPESAAEPSKKRGS